MIDQSLVDLPVESVTVLSAELSKFLNSISSSICKYFQKVHWKRTSKEEGKKRKKIIIEEGTVLLHKLEDF